MAKSNQISRQQAESSMQQVGDDKYNLTAVSCQPPAGKKCFAQSVKTG
jgi:hypothetical protein